MLNTEQVKRYRELPNPPQSLYNALKKASKYKKESRKVF